MTEIASFLHTRKRILHHLTSRDNSPIQIYSEVKNNHNNTRTATTTRPQRMCPKSGEKKMCTNLVSEADRS